MVHLFYEICLFVLNVGEMLWEHMWHPCYPVALSHCGG